MDAHFSALEQKSREILAKGNPDGRADTPRVFVLNVFRAMWQYAMPAEKIARIGTAMSDMNIDPEILQAALTGLVRDKVLSSRMSCGTRVYEINLPIHV